MIQSLLSSNRPLALMLLKAHKDVFTSIIGEHNTKIKGRGYDFVELREYTSGEDIKYIDWTISSKLGKPHVKVFQEQRELNIAIVPLLCASLNFGLQVLKQDILTEISALLSFSSIKQNNPFVSYISNEDTLLCSQKGKSLENVREFIEKIASYDTRGHSINYRLLSSRLFTQLKSKSMVFLIGDFFHAEAFDISTLAIKHELIVIVVRDRFEEEPPALGEMQIIDPETGENAYVDLSKKASLGIKKEIQEEDALFFEKLKKSGVKFMKVYTDENPSHKILSLMSDL